jgi:lysophospholipase L1-like esterase
VKSLLKNLVALFIGSIGALLLLEMFLRFYNPLQSTVKGQRIVLLANQRYVIENHTIRKLDRTIVHTKNSLGFRGNEPPQEFGKYLTLVTIGGSTTECKYLSDGQTWTDILGQQLAKDFDRVWINNAGLDGHSSFGHTVLMTDHISKLKPKLALFLVGINDVGRDDLKHSELQHIRGRIDAHSIRGFIKSVSSYSETFALLLNTYRHYRAVTTGLSHREVDLTKVEIAPATAANGRARGATDKNLKSYETRLLRLINLTRESNIEPVLITQPALHGDGIDDATGIDLGRIQKDGTDAKRSWDNLEMYNEITRRVGKRENVLVIDLARELPKSSRYFYDYFHYTNEGANKVGDIVHRRLSPYLKTKFHEYAKHPASRLAVGGEL